MKTASGPAAYTPGLLAAGIGASVGVMAGLGALLSEDGGGTGGMGRMPGIHRRGILPAT